MLILGEVHTGLLQNSVPLPAEQVGEILQPLSSDPIRRYERPLPQAISADRPVGVDCRLPTGSGTSPHVVGTVLWHASIIGGHLTQGSAFARVVRSAEGRRMPWSHYTAFPGRLESLTGAKPAEVARGFLNAGPNRPEHLDTAAIATQALDRVQRSALLDRQPALRTRRTRLRWAAVGTGPAPQPTVATFRIESDNLRSVLIHGADEMMPQVMSLCEDLALHDWLLTTVSRQLELIVTHRVSGLAKTELLRPVMEYFLHLWMPGAWIDEQLLPVWDALERRPGFTRQWETAVARIRDQIGLSTLELLQNRGAAETAPAPARRSKPKPGREPRLPRIRRR